MNEDFSLRSRLPPWGAVVLSAWLTGAGQVAVGRVRAGVLWMLVMLSGLGVLLWTVIATTLPGFRATAMVGGVLAGSWLLMLVHAYRCCPRPAAPGASWPWVAAWLSWVIPGLGQLCRRQWWSGLAFLLAMLVTGFLPSPWDKVGFSLLAAGSAFHLLGHDSARQAVLTVLVARVVIGLMLIVGARTLVVQPFRMPTGAMAPTIQPGDHLFTDKLTYRLRPPQRGEIVVFRTDSLADLPAPSRGQFYIKRIVGLPGERVSLRPPQVLINGQPVRVAGIKYVLPPTFLQAKYLPTEADSVLLGPDEYLVLGDNSPRSFDSRFWGPIRRDAIIGRAVKVYWPFARAGITFGE